MCMSSKSYVLFCFRYITLALPDHAYKFDLHMSGNVTISRRLPDNHLVMESNHSEPNLNMAHSELDNLSGLVGI